MALIVVGAIVAFLAVFSIWANRQLLETDNWVETSSELLEDEEIRGQLSNFMVDTIYANVNVQGELEQALPPEAPAPGRARRRRPPHAARPARKRGPAAPARAGSLGEHQQGDARDG